MTRFILRTALTTLALVLLFAGSFNLNRTSANGEVVGVGGVEVVVAPSKCAELAGCPGGSITCGTLILPDGTIVKCGMPQGAAR
jgi:hypothetical protein